MCINKIDEGKKQRAAQGACNDLIDSNGNTNFVGGASGGDGGDGGSASGSGSANGGNGGSAEAIVDGVTIVGNNLAICRISFLNGDTRVTVERQVEIPAW